MLTCKEASVLLSKASDTRLGWRTRLALRLHLLVCEGCTQFAKQLRVLRGAARALAARPDPYGDWRLPEAARDRIARALQARD